MRRGWQVTGIVMLLICIVAGWEATNLALFDRLGPGAGFFPFYLALIGAVLSVLLIVQVSRVPAAPRNGETIFPRGGTALRGVAILVLVALAIAALDWLGFRLTVSLFSAALLLAMGERRWWAVLLFALIAGFGLFYVFNNWLDVVLPIGEFGIDQVEGLEHLIAGFAGAATLGNLTYALIGCVLGTLIGVLPGLGPAAGTAILIPITFNLDATGAIIMLCAIYYGAMYGGTITSVLINVPGEAASVITCIDGYQMARQGRAGAALAIAAVGSFVGGCAATVALAFVAIPLAKLALQFGPAEFFALMVLGLCLVIGLAGRNLVAALLMTVLGLLLAMIGIDPVRGAPRFTGGIPDLFDGVGFVPVAMGLFGIAELLIAAEQYKTQALKAELTHLWPRPDEMGPCVKAILRGTGIGFVLGMIPGVGAVIPTFMAYVTEKRLSRHPERFGNGAIEGVAAPETANNAYANASMIPLFALGVPSSATIAVLMGAFIINGLTPGPFLFQERPELVWAVIASFFIGNAMLLALNLPLVGLWARLLRMPFRYLCVGVLIFCIIGAYSLKQTTFDVWVMLGFGVIGYVLRKLEFPLAPLILAMILGPMMEKSLRTTLEISNGSAAIFLDRPVALVLLIIPALILGVLVFRPRALEPLREGDSE